MYPLESGFGQFLPLLSEHARCLMPALPYYSDRHARISFFELAAMIPLSKFRGTRVVTSKGIVASNRVQYEPGTMGASDFFLRG